MKKAVSLVWCLLLAALLLTAAGSGTDPLISLSYLTGEYSQNLDAAITARLDASDQALLAGQVRPASSPDASGPEERTLKEGDVLSAASGFTVTVLGGDMRLEITAGAVVDATAGTETPSGQILQQNHRYIAAENTAAELLTVSPAAVAVYEGNSVLHLSASPDYYAIACALRTLDLFRGSGSGIGEGFELYDPLSRGEGLVLFLRLLGEEDAALAWEGSHPFADVPLWLDPYVAWAWKQGYANGVSADRFGCAQTLSAVEYTEFLLRAMGLSRAGVDDYTASLERAAAGGLLTDGEYESLRSRDFLRGHAAYISYYALDVPVDGGTETLAQRLIRTGRVTEEQLAEAKSGVSSLRIF